MTSLRISELAARSGVPSTTLRYYEQVGLLAAGRTPSGYRVYDEAAVERLRFISAAKRMQLSLDAIRELLQTWQEESCRTVKARLRPMVSSRLFEAEDAVRALNELVAQLRSDLVRLDALPDRDRGCDPSCAFLDVAAVPVEVVQDGCSCSPDSTGAVPACSLSGDDHRDRLARWHALLDNASLTHSHLGVSVVLPVDLVGQVVDLVAAERRCCPFLGFTVAFLDDTVELTITAQNESAVPFVRALFPSLA